MTNTKVNKYFEFIENRENIYRENNHTHNKKRHIQIIYNKNTIYSWSIEQDPF